MLKGGRLLAALMLGVSILNGCMFFDEIDRCLDRGGAWNDTTGVCEFSDPEPRSDSELTMERQLR